MVEITRIAKGGVRYHKGMLSGRLVHLIESRSEEIISSVISHIRREPDLAHYRAILESELREFGLDTLRNLGHWLTSGQEQEIATRYEQLGKRRFGANIPLHESVHAFCILRERVLDFVEEHVFNKNSLELYEQEELDRRLGRFFNVLTVHMVKGYEHELRTELACARR
jgi:hypothetical protein